MTLEKAYDPQKSEKKIYDFWLENDLFDSKVDKNKKPFTIVMPPPNITGRLHLGHAMDTTIQDVLIRYKRMKGYEVLWVPGTDHAALATEVKVVKTLLKDNKTKESLGRKGFLKYVNNWKDEYRKIITSQIKSLGASCDWKRERFTMDEGCSRAVNQFFVALYEKGLIYRGEKIINWCPNCGTSIADSEVDYVPEKANLYFLKYKFTDSEKFLSVATTRPETIFGDVAIAVNPSDERYSKFIGKKVVVPLAGREIPIIADDTVKIDFGTGALKVTPAHSMDDFEIGIRHKLKVINTIDKHGVMNENTGDYEGIERFQARKEIVDSLKNKGLIVKVESYEHNIGVCYRCATVVEPRISTQWFVKMRDLADAAIRCVKNGDTVFIPNRFEKIFFHWMENIKDWCISRQIWWGHRIPVWYCGDCKNVMVSKIGVSECEKCGSSNVHQDEDTLDTWFSAALWPFSVLGWPEKTQEMDYFFPTSVIVTGYDILFFWVAKMIFASVVMTGRKPFDKVFLHGLIRDAKGRKMSKSLDNGIDPIQMVQKYGADALRISLLRGNSPGNDLCFSEEKVTSSRNFINKIWNAARFIMMNIDSNESDSAEKIPKNLDIFSKWIISKLKNIVEEITKNIEKFEFGLVVEKLSSFIWSDFCDWYLEFAKISLNNAEDYSKDTKNVLKFVFTNILKILHPFAPFVTEQIWQFFPHGSEYKSVMISNFPDSETFRDFEFEESTMEEVEFLIELVRRVRNKRNEFKSLGGKETKLVIKTRKEFLKNGELKVYISKLTKIESAEVRDLDDDEIGNGVKFSLADTKVFLVNPEKFDTDFEISRLEKTCSELETKLKKMESQLGNEKFMKSAPKNIVEKISENSQKLKQKIDNIREDITYFRSVGKSQ